MSVQKCQQLVDAVLVDPEKADLAKFGADVLEVLPDILNEVGLLRRKIAVADKMISPCSKLLVGVIFDEIDLGANSIVEILTIMEEYLKV